MFFFSLILLFYPIFSQPITFTEIYKQKAVNQWQEGSYSSTVYYEKNDGSGIIVGSSYWQIYCVNAYTGDVIWLIDQDNTIGLDPRFENGIVMVENFRVDGDVVFIVGGDKTQLLVIDVDGNIMEMFYVDLPVGRDVADVLAVKFDTNDPWSVVVGLPSTNMGRYPNTWVYDNYMSLKWRRPLPNSDEGTNSLGVFGKNIGVGDLDGNGQLSLVIPSDDFGICVWDKDGVIRGVSNDFYNSENKDLMWSKVIFSRDYTLEYGGWAGSHHDFKPFFAHGIATVFEVDNKPVIAISGLYGSGYDLTSTRYEYHTVFLLNEDRTRYENPNIPGCDWKLSYEDCKDFHDPDDMHRLEINIAYADLNANGYPELIFPCSDGRVHAVGLNKQPPYGSWPIDLGGTLRFASEVAIFQRPGEGPHVIFTTWGSRTIKSYKGELYMVDHQGIVVERFSLPSTILDNASGSTTGVTLFRKKSGSNLYAAVMTHYAGLCLYEIQNTHNATILWGTNRGNFQRNGMNNKVVQYPFVPGEDTYKKRQIISAIVASIISVFIFIIFVIAFVLIFIFSYFVFVEMKRRSGKNYGKLSFKMTTISSGGKKKKKGRKGLG